MRKRGSGYSQWRVEGKADLSYDEILPYGIRSTSKCARVGRDTAAFSLVATLREEALYASENAGRTSAILTPLCAGLRAWAGTLRG